MDINSINAVLLEGTLALEGDSIILLADDGRKHDLTSILREYEGDEVRFTVASLTDLATLAQILENSPQ